MRTYMGLDVGGTKTYCLIANANGHVLGFGRAGTGSYEYKGVAAAAAENRRAVEEALTEAGLGMDAIAAIGMGVAGADLEEDFDMLEREIYTPLFGETRRVFRNDSFAALRGGTRNASGIVIACGTGCVCAGRDPAGRETRVGGIGPEFGDRCTGTTIGIEGLLAVWRARDDIIPPTTLTELFLRRAGCRDVDELFHRMYRKQLTYDDLQPMARLVFEAASGGDRAACDILRSGGEYLGDMVNAVAHRLNMVGTSFELVMAGSVLAGSDRTLKDAMCARVQEYSPDARPIMPRFEPVVGAWLLGRDLDEQANERLYANLEKGLGELERRRGVSLKASKNHE